MRVLSLLRSTEDEHPPLHQSFVRQSHGAPEFRDHVGMVRVT
jgi:hypothetical protein